MHAAPMHDIGKIATPDAVLLKPGRLTPEEWEIMKQHPTVGLQILDGSQRPILKAAAVIAHQHHEKYDGSGYPQGLKGEDIHPYARIVAVADVFDALTHKRCYKEAWPIGRCAITCAKSPASTSIRSTSTCSSRISTGRTKSTVPGPTKNTYVG
jgi:response regulator RpfG family c-di-GMP phosphodiesterase